MQTSTPNSNFQEWERGWALPGRCQSTLASPGLSWCQLWIQLPILPRVPPWETQAQQHKEPFSSPAGSSHGPHSVPGAGPRQVGSAALSWIQSLSRRWDPDGSHGFIHSIPVIHNALVSRQGLHLPLPQTLQLPRLCKVLLALEGLPQHPRSIPLLPAWPRTAPAIPNLPPIPSIQERHSLGAHEEQGGTQSIFGCTAGHKAVDSRKGLEPENGTDAPVFTGQSTISLSSCCQA